MFGFVHLIDLKPTSILEPILRLGSKDKLKKILQKMTLEK